MKLRNAFYLFLLQVTALSASTSTSNMSISAVVDASCTISANNLSFGTYNPISSSPNNTNTTVVVQCTNTSPYNVGLDLGQGTGASLSNRLMTKSGGATLNYNLYSDAAHTQVIGSTIGTNTISGTGNGSTQNITIYGQIPGSQNVTSGTYTDLVVATVYF